MDESTGGGLTTLAFSHQPSGGTLLTYSPDSGSTKKTDLGIGTVYDLDKDGDRLVASGTSGRVVEVTRDKPTVQETPVDVSLYGLAFGSTIAVGGSGSFVVRKRGYNEASKDESKNSTKDESTKSASDGSKRGPTGDESTKQPSGEGGAKQRSSKDTPKSASTQEASTQESTETPSTVDRDDTGQTDQDDSEADDPDEDDPDDEDDTDENDADKDGSAEKGSAGANVASNSS